MTYQKCPICNGSWIDNTNMYTSTLAPCPTCDGKKIINTISGKPPKYNY